MADESGSIVDKATTVELASSKTDDAATLQVPADDSWSKVLGSPTDLTSFSPSMEFNGGNLHGFGRCFFQLVENFHVRDHAYHNGIVSHTLTPVWPFAL